MADPGDPYDLERFVRAQERVHVRALAEISGGEKSSHWMWFIFPQLDGLAVSPSSDTQHFSIKSIEEARAYLAHPVLGPRLTACAEAAVAVEGRSAEDIFGKVDARKLR